MVVPRRWLADASLLLVTLIWGTTFVVVKEALTAVTPAAFLALRFLLATVALCLVAGPRLRRLSRADLRGGLLLGLFLFAGFFFQTTGLQTTSASAAAFITGLSVVIVPGLAWLTLGQRPSRAVWVGVILATVGLALLTLRETPLPQAGDLLVLLCALAFAGHIVATGALAPHSPPLALTTVQVATVALLSLPLAGPSLTLALPGEVWAAVAFTGLGATALVFAVQTWAQRYTSPTHAALIFTLEPVFAALFAALVAGERLTPPALVGAALMLAGMLVAELGRGPETTPAARALAGASGRRA